MKKNKLNRLLSLSKIQSYSKEEWRMSQYLISWFENNSIPYYKDEIGNLYATKGEAETYPCIVAHIDTVFPIEKDLTVVRVGDNLVGFNKYTMQQRGVGFDDKAGIWIALECLLTTPNLKVAFFIEEELGCNGSYEADMGFFNDVGYVIQCDRQCASDLVTDACGVELSSQDFQQDILETMYKHGYDYSSGGMTDVMALKEMGLDVSCMNMSCGYYNPHCEDEYLSLEDVSNTLSFVENIISSLGEKTYPHKFVKKPNKPYVYPKYYSAPEHLCEDCWQEEAESNGLCKKCNAFYKMVSFHH